NAKYIRGDTSKEKRLGGNLRNRTIVTSNSSVQPTVLGDIVNSTPYHVKELDTIFVGGNDGMLHAINAKPGNTVGGVYDGRGTVRFFDVRGFSSATLAELATLIDPDYIHKYFVDGPIVVSNKAQQPGKNFLVGAQGRGSKGLFGLNVSDPYNIM